MPKIIINNTEVLTGASQFTGATETADGANGLVPAPAKADKEKYLKGDGTWAAASSYWVGTKAEYEALTEIETDKLYIIKS